MSPNSPKHSQGSNLICTKPRLLCLWSCHWALLTQIPPPQPVLLPRLLLRVPFHLHRRPKPLTGLGPHGHAPWACPDHANAGHALRDSHSDSETSGRPLSPGPSVMTTATSHSSLGGSVPSRHLGRPLFRGCSGRQSPSQMLSRGEMMFHWAPGRRESRF